MKNRATEYYNKGYNCSQCILKAFESKYKIPINKQSYEMCTGINTGLGIGTTCSVLVAGIMIFGILFDEQTAKRLRIKLLAMFKERHRSLNCDALTKEKGAGRRCDRIVAEVAELIDIIISEEGRL